MFHISLLEDIVILADAKFSQKNAEELRRRIILLEAAP
jgi:hypothetical protein